MLRRVGIPQPVVRDARAARERHVAVHDQDLAVRPVVDLLDRYHFSGWNVPICTPARCSRSTCSRSMPLAPTASTMIRTATPLEAASVSADVNSSATWPVS